MSGRETVPAPGPVADFAPDARGGRLPFMAETEDDELHSSLDDRCQFIKEELIIDSDEKSGEEDRPELDGAAAGAAGEARFGWERLGGGLVACLWRRGERFCLARALDPVARFGIHHDIFSCCPARAVRATPNEVRLLGAGRALKVGEPLLRVRDARRLLTFALSCRMRLSQCSPSDPPRFAPCGFVRRHEPRALLPYVLLESRPYVPVFYFRNDPAVSHLLWQMSLRRLDCWDLAYIKFCCRAVRADEEVFSADFCDAIDFTEVQKCYSAANLFHDYWPENPFKEQMEIGNTAHAIKIRDPTPPIQVVENLSTNEQSPPDVSFTSDQIVRKRRPYTKRKPKYSESSEGNQSTTNETERSSDGESSSAARQVKKLNETREEREKRLQVARDRRSLETDEQRRKRLECLKKYQSKRIANETEEQRRMRLYKLRIYHSNRIANETKEQRERRLLKTRLYQKERIAKLKLEKAMMNNSTEENQNDESSNADSN